MNLLNFMSQDLQIPAFQALTQMLGLIVILIGVIGSGIMVSQRGTAKGLRDVSMSLTQLITVIRGPEGMDIGLASEVSKLREWKHSIGEATQVIEQRERHEFDIHVLQEELAVIKSRLDERDRNESRR